MLNCIQKLSYDEFNNNYFTLINKPNLATHYQAAFKKRIYRYKKTYENNNKYNINNIIKDQQIKTKLTSSNSINNISYNPNEYFNENKYAIPTLDKQNIIEQLEENKNNKTWLLEKSLEFKNKKLKFTELDNLINDFIKTLDTDNNKYKKIYTKDYDTDGVDILIVYSKGGFRMIDKQYCKILGCDATFDISPQKELWSKINKSYAQVCYLYILFNKF